ncbi:DUF350 domain-containing protein [Polluticaenibacter yanchengensis]|uniref:DUF350 domain-containing protein n=1 Tax=Polluticaenibacter yanchengensis TaxID=3014562 RepID=A0ABT4UEI7_9BACT|nr:DUF350 domain-containing protein [Chitinophagaceae bacterium LY-5]
MIINFHQVGNSLIFAGIGIITLLAAFVIVELLTPKHNLFKEIFEKQNTAVALVMGFFLIAIAIIIAASIHG